jgi:hypothetical protein
MSRSVPQCRRSLSLSQPASSLGPITACGQPLRSGYSCHTGLWLLFEVGASPPAISRRPTHHLAEQTGTSPVPPEVDLRPPE